ncbi:MAG: carboxy terminal-processing peptidase [Bacteriovoracaceae bacterium]|nr:carboxy terminal-processing peptidase [Bacteriovoracaceae bacterium]
MRKFLVTFLMFIISINIAVAKGPSKKKKAVADPRKDKLLGTLIKNALENYHYKHLVINDDVSKKAFEEYLKRVDYGKQFLLKKDIDGLRKFNSKMDDQLVNGQHKLIQETQKILDKRVKQVDSWRAEYFKKSFNFKTKEELQLDPDKRKWNTSEKEMKEHWRKQFKNFTLSRYLAIRDEQKDDEDNKDKKKEKKKKKKEKKLTDSEMRKKAHEKVDKKYKKILKRLLERDHIDYSESFINALANIYDPHTLYMPPKRKEDFDIDISGSLEGIGAVLQEDGDYIKVVRIVPGGAAWRQKGLEVDDIITLVKDDFKAKEGVDLVGMGVDEAVRYIRGKKDTVVKLTVKKSDGSRKVIPILRDVIKIGASYAKSSVLTHKKLGLKIGYITVPKFYRDFGNGGRNCTDDVRRELVELKKQNIDAMILDLRNNGGGALEDARQMSGLFIKTGPIVQIKDHRQKIDVLRDDDSSVTYDGPLVVMTNRYSASASEILAGAMQDYRRAVIVGGEYSHGKGTVQAVLDLNRNPIASIFGEAGMGALKVTIQKFYRVTGASTQYKGVTPDIILPDPMGYTKNREKDLDYSLKWDKVKPLNFTPWKKGSWDMALLKKRSSKRVKSSKKYGKIQKSLDYLISKREDTVASLNLDTVLKEDEENVKMTKQLKIEDENKQILVSNFEKSLRGNIDIKKEDEDHWKEDFKKSKEEWVKQLRTDAGLEEALFIIDDMVKINKGKKLGMVK